MKQDIRKDFPMLESNIIYFDNSSTSLKPYSVLESITEFYTKYTSNAYRGSYINSEYISLKIDETRELVATMLNCSPWRLGFILAIFCFFPINKGKKGSYEIYYSER